VFVLLLAIGWLVSLCSPSHTHTAATTLPATVTTPSTSYVRPAALSPVGPGSANVVAPGGQVELPDVAGQNAKDAENELKYLGLTNVELTSANPKYHMVLVPANWTVVSVDPPAGTAVSTNGRVVLDVTKD
jgi:hypothetical protein